MHSSTLCGLLVASGVYAAPTISARPRFIESLGPPGEISEPGTFGSPYALTSGPGSKRECTSFEDGICTIVLPYPTANTESRRFIEPLGPPGEGSARPGFGSPYALDDGPEKRIVCPLVDGIESCEGPIFEPIATPLNIPTLSEEDKRMMCPLVGGVESCGGPIVEPIEPIVPIATPLVAREQLSIEDRLNLAYDPSFQHKRLMPLQVEKPSVLNPEKAQVTRRATLSERRSQPAPHARPLEGFTGPRTAAPASKRMTPLEVVGPIPEGRSSTVERPIYLNGEQVGQLKQGTFDSPSVTGSFGSANILATFRATKRGGVENRAPWRVQETQLPQAQH